MRSDLRRLAQGLGLFSIGLGLTEFLAPRALARWLGLPGRRPPIAAFGLREIGTGAGLLLAEDKTPWLWARVAGDALDLAALAEGLAASRRRDRVALALAAVIGVTALDLFCAGESSVLRPAPLPVRDYGNRSGLPRPPEAMRGAARDFEVPRDMRTPEALRPWTTG